MSRRRNARYYPERAGIAKVAGIANTPPPPIKTNVDISDVSGASGASGAWEEPDGED